MKRNTTQLKIISSSFDLLGELENALKRRNPTERRIAKTILEDPISISGMTISQLAEASETSVASVVRFCKSMGSPGYRNFRLSLAREMGRIAASDDGQELDGGITKKDSMKTIIKKIAYADSKAIESTAKHLDENTAKLVVDAWQRSKIIGIVGVASSAFVALDLQLKLNRLGKQAVAWHDVHTALTSIAMLGPGDVLLAISHSGLTHDVIEVIEEFKKRDVTIVLITNSTQSPAAQKSDLVLYTSAKETTFRSGATASRIAQLTVIDCLCVAFAQRNWDKTLQALDLSRSAILARSNNKRKRTT